MVLNPMKFFRAFRSIPEDRPQVVGRIPDERIKAVVTMTCEEAEDLKTKIEQIALDADLTDEEKETLRRCERVLNRGGS